MNDTRVLSLRLPADLAAALDHLPNRSEFIRDAIAAYLGALCPTCLGTGRVVQPGTLDHVDEGSPYRMR